MDTTVTNAADTFLALHRTGQPLLLPNASDPGMACLFQAMGFAAVATTSGGHAATMGRLDGSVASEEALTAAAAMVRAVEIPVSADLEDGFAADPEGVANTVRVAARVGLAGCSIEDFTRDADNPILELGAARARVAAAAEVASRSPRLVLTARSENYLRGRPDLDDTIARLQAFQEAGADVLFAPGLTALADIRAVVDSVDRPVNVLALPGGPSVAELAEAGVARVSVGSAFALVALAAVADAARELQEQGTYGFWDRALEGRRWAQRAFTAHAVAPG